LFGAVGVESDDELFDRALARSFQDLRMLVTRECGENFFAAGIPWFDCLFGRDNIVTALQTLACDPGIAAETLLLLVKYRGRRHDEWRDEEPGKICTSCGSTRRRTWARRPRTPYYGTVEATPLFCCLLAEYVRWTGDLTLFSRLEGNLGRALAWIDGLADHDGDGFVDYESKSAKGLANQGWKDSGNAIANEDGSPVVPPVALVEVQGYVYRAKLDAAWLYRLAGEDERADQLETAAARLRERFERAYWLPERRFLAVALRRELVVRRPILPDWLREITLRGLRVGAASVDLRFRRIEGETAVALLERTGELNVRIER
jgi:glycogen debranching enzyme